MAQEHPEAKTRLFSVDAIKAAFRAAAKAVINKLAPTPAQRRKRREETEGGFKMARAITVKIKQTIIRFMYSSSRHDPKAERQYADEVLREQMEEWSQEDEQEAEESFQCARAVGFDPQP